MIKIRLDKLEVSALNPRKTEPTDAETAALAASIEAIGLINPLIVEPANKKGQHGVLAGGRRLRALQQLMADGKMKGDALIDCAVREADADIVAVADNAVRKALNPVEEYRAYGQLVKAGHKIPVIAATFGVTERGVRQRLKLANVHPKILSAYEHGDIDAGALQAFTVTDDQARQLEVFEAATNPRWLNHHNVRSDILGDDYTRNARTLKAVGEDAYVEAGGTFTEDLFSESRVVNNPELLQKVIVQKIDAEIERLKAEGWRWIEPLPEGVPYYDIESKLRLKRLPMSDQGDLTDEEWEEFEALAEEEVSADEIEWSDETVERFDELSRRSNIATWTKDQRAHAGGYVWFDANHTSDPVRSSLGWLRKADLSDAIAAGAAEEPAAPPEDDGEKPEFSAVLMQDLARVYTLAVKTGLLDKPELALDVLVAHHTGRGFLAMTYGATASLPDPEAVGVLSIDERLEHSWFHDHDEIADIQKAGKKARNARLAEWVAIHLPDYLPRQSPQLDLIAEQVKADVRKVWKPDTRFFQRLTKPQLTEVFEEVVGKTPGQCGLTGKKDIFVRVLTGIFDNPDAAHEKGYSDKVHATSKAWLPKPLRPAKPEAETEKEAA